jgi:hypothetical protein
MYKDLCLISMILTYSYIIYSVASYYENNNSISSIIKNKNCNSKIFVSMFIMEIFTILYEILRYNLLSFIFIFLVVIGINGLLIYDDTYFIHYIYCILVFINILLFMIHNSYYKNNNFLYFLLYLQIILSFSIVLFNNILYIEMFLLENFALYYISLHFL